MCSDQKLVLTYFLNKHLKIEKASNENVINFNTLLV